MSSTVIPIYYIIAKNQNIDPTFMIWNIIECIECTLGDVERIYREKVEPMMFFGGYTISTFIFYREPNNILRTMNNG